MISCCCKTTRLQLIYTTVASLWFFVCYFQCRSGYEKASRNFNQADLDVDISRWMWIYMQRKKKNSAVPLISFLSPTCSLSFMVTGANSGLGKVTALELAKKGETICSHSQQQWSCSYWKFVMYFFNVVGATVHLVCRNPERGETAKQEIRTQSNNEVTNISQCLLSQYHNDMHLWVVVFFSSFLLF